MSDRPLDRKQPNAVPFIPARGRVGCLTGDPCGEHHKLTEGRCCCGGTWPGTMTCHGCRNPGHGADECVDGPPPPGGRYGVGRSCNCQHKPSGLVLAGRPGR